MVPILKSESGITHIVPYFERRNLEGWKVLPLECHKEILECCQVEKLFRMQDKALHVKHLIARLPDFLKMSQNLHHTVIFGDTYE